MTTLSFLLHLSPPLAPCSTFSFSSSSLKPSSNSTRPYSRSSSSTPHSAEALRCGGGALSCCCYHADGLDLIRGSRRRNLLAEEGTGCAVGVRHESRHPVRCSINDESTTTDYQPGTSSEGQSKMVLPKVGSETSSGGGGGLGDLSLLQTRRFWLGTSVGVLAALGGNLGGVTSAIFNLNPQVSRGVRADVLFPVKGFKRCLESSQGFEFIYPVSWVGDQRLLYRAVERAERERSLDLPPIQRRPAPKREFSGDPIVAFGPPGTDGELNVSVVVAPVNPGFSLQQIGGPRESGELILKKFIAPEGSKKEAILLNSEQRTIENQFYYDLEYTVKGSTFFRHNLSVYTTKSGRLYSLNAQTPESDWKSVERDFREIANSFRLLL